MTRLSPTPSDATAAPIPWARIALWFLVTRVMMFGIAALSLRIIVNGPFFYRPGGPIDWFMQWDARWYLSIARDGYSYDPTQMSAVNFLPMFPMCIRAVGWVVRDVDLAAYIVSNAFCFAAAAMLWRLTRDVDGRAETADASVLFFLLGPVAVFFSSIYSESTFIFFSIATLWAARRQRWVAAGLLGAAAALSRSLGVLLCIPLAIEFLAAHRTMESWRAGRTWLRLLCCGLPAVGTLAYVAFLGWKFGDPMAYVISQRHGGHTAGAPWTLFATPEFKGLSEFYRYWFGASAIAAVALVVVGALMRIPVSFSVYAAALCAVYLSTRSLEGLPRFFSVVVPFYLTLGRLHSRWPSLGTILITVCAALLCFSVILFVNGYWFT